MKHLLAGLAGAVVAAVATGQDPAAIPVADFVRLPEAISAKLSPNGDYIAVSKYVNDNQHAVGVTELATNKVTAILAFSKGESIGGYWWVNPTRVVASLATDYGPLDQPYLTGELYAVDANGKNSKYLFGYRGSDTAGTRIKSGTIAKRAWATMAAILPADSQHALIHVRSWDSSKDYSDIAPVLERINVNDGRRKVVDTVGLLTPAVAATEAGKPLMVVGYDRDGNAELRARSPDDTGWVPVSLPGGTPDAFGLYGISRDGTAGYFSSDEVSPQCLREYVFASRAIVELACGEFDSVVMSTAENKPIALEFEDGLPRVQYLLPDHPEARRLRGLSAAFPGQRVSLGSTSRDGSKVLLLVASDRDPGGYYLLDETTKRVRFLLPRRRWIDPKLMQPMVPVTIKASDGLELPAYVTAREGLKTRKAPLVVLPHGGPHGVRDYWGWDPEVQLLASRGYAVLQVNYRGSGGYGREFAVRGERHWGTRIQQDIADATRWMIAQGIADPARICIYGGSFGGYSALMSAATEPDLYRCAAGFAGVYDLPAQAADSDTADSRLGRIYLHRVLSSDETVLREQSPVSHVARIKAALLIAHGTADRRVPFSQAKLLRKALDDARKPYEWLEYKGEEHGFFDEKNKVDFYTRLLAFLDKNIGPGAKAPAAGGG